jgi:hypothetical protein
VISPFRGEVNAIIEQAAASAGNLKRKPAKKAQINVARA